MIEFLISKGFVISGKDDLYGNNRESYILSKTITPEYCGDLYDWENIGEWYLNLMLNAQNIEDHPVVDSRSFDRHMQIPSGLFRIEALVEIKDQEVDLDPVEILHNHCMKSHYHLPIFVARSFSKRAIKFANENGVIIFSSDDIEKTVGWRPPIFCEGPIKGMVVSIKPDFLLRLLKGSAPFFYVKGGPVGKKLQKGQYLVFYSTDPEKSINAIGEIKSINLGTPQEIWNRFGDKLVLSENEYFRLSGIKQSIVAIELDQIKKINPIKEKELDSIIPKKDRSGSYIDEKTLNKIVGK
jgi:predicted transcriptional regulator